MRHLRTSACDRETDIVACSLPGIDGRLLGAILRPSTH